MGGEIFRTCPDRPWGPPNLLYNGHRVFPGGKERPGRDAHPSPLLVPWSRKGRAIYLYSLCRPYGLYKASMPVQGCTLPLLYTMKLNLIEKLWLTESRSVLLWILGFHVRAYKNSPADAILNRIFQQTYIVFLEVTLSIK